MKPITIIWKREKYLFTTGKQQDFKFTSIQLSLHRAFKTKHLRIQLFIGPLIHKWSNQSVTGFSFPSFYGILKVVDPIISYSSAPSLQPPKRPNALRSEGKESILVSIIFGFYLTRNRIQCDLYRKAWILTMILTQV